MKIKVMYHDSVSPLEITKKGDWIDLRAAKEFEYEAPFANTLKKGRDARNLEFDTLFVPLGISMELPKGFEAHILPRSSTFRNYGLVLANSQGIIDNTYCSQDDIWATQWIVLKAGKIDVNDRICQFRIQLSQKANIFQKLRWLFTSKIKFVPTNHLKHTKRGGFGSTGKV